MRERVFVSSHHFPPPKFGKVEVRANSRKVFRHPKYSVKFQEKVFLQDQIFSLNIFAVMIPGNSLNKDNEKVNFLRSEFPSE